MTSTRQNQLLSHRIRRPCTTTRTPSLQPIQLTFTAIRSRHRRLKPDAASVTALAAHSSESDPTKIVQNTFQSKWLSQDGRAAYASTNYPLIESAHRFVNPLLTSSLYAYQTSLARFRVDGRFGTGDYILVLQVVSVSICRFNGFVAHLPPRCVNVRT